MARMSLRSTAARLRLGKRYWTGLGSLPSPRVLLSTRRHSTYELDAGTAPSYPSFSAASRTYPTWDVARSVAQTPQHPALDVATSESIENAYHHHQIPGWNVPHMGAEYIEDAEDDIGVDYQGDEDYDFTTAFGSDLLSSYANDAVSYSMYFPPVPSADNSTLGTYTYTHPENNLSPYPQWPQPATSSPVPNQTETTNPDTDATPTRTRPRPPLRPPSPSSGPSNDTSLNANAPTSPPRLNRNPRGPPYSCPNPTCASTTQFARHADLMRHAQTVHRRDGALLLDCPRRNCVRRGANGFSRRDHLREHLRAWHMVDIPKRGTRSRGVVGGGRGRGRGRWV
ncbi:uncharacterized protein K452DRAFT_88965 [Aplosporella prunicola CBS 121167]|uniref:C2H2-type domain-containing protein n=1 Tax=Aplosporella prunicola CBS 121167 TaxID=1176127 RepID=A0A6A6B719_9PEZI|nr:uncharacterized protein K452DRAFT_88965 [Aplosporella prunicola CBS 121167]KAF2138601.1 hypothetical protein K452DRAFT_88965 [Aplosporella prunicola CBS 121167]